LHISGQAGAEKEFLKLLTAHWPTLNRLGLVHQEPRLVFRGKDGEKTTFFVEIFAWKNGRIFKRAHEYPEVTALWEPMEKMCEKRNGYPACEFPHVESLELPRT
jgi:hypothetical protein